ncbi:acetolactate synthase small subunit [Prosthecochloris sp. N3]|uniref:Acetolactate synthase small subunit n=1 Tax=Prosthecochloris ethylica TaxID=2743976 RepID=A0ABR9XS17_9CHLB|nr:MULTISPECIES: acetolactate synthase small subunit [Prosthecochloris]MEC9486606.1 acetolactate synthase small subunit [Prosthecochloris sp.]MBF0586786.1 acetolactate synthase small subunit [Prosthecochloris ethylica]MBF0636692.1 acetolactate synthase small subunit [Prosthecochloris ethylica]NUK47909.1 acetolactate synthase small subunit [Prosthecochloris ethylica]RNA65211.1 acetolactate synthase small subunit [Prosthecochloris sp. ZM_2]
MKHIISVLVENKFGTLNRVAAMFSARGFNLESISIGETEDTEISRMTIVTRGDDRIINQILKQLNRLIDTIKVIDLTNQPHISRELLLMTLKLSKSTQHEIFELINVFKGKVVDIKQKSITIEVVGSPDKINTTIDMFRSFGIKEIARSGTVALNRGEH